MVYARTPLPQLVSRALKPNPLLRHVITADMFTPDLIDQLFQRSLEMGYSVHHDARNRRLGNILRGRIMYRLFAAESTRTYESFGMAGAHMGMTVFGTQGVTFSSESKSGEALSGTSEAKGETRLDTFSSLSAFMPSLFIYRSKNIGDVAAAALTASVPIINGGDGSGEHPSQALLDLFTIQQEVGRLDNLRIAIIGDSWNSRVARSDAILLNKFPGNHIDFISPPEFRMRDDILTILRESGTSYEIHDRKFPAVSEANIVMVLRMQKERATQEQIALVTNHPEVIARYRFGPSDAAAMRPDGRILHPLPRVDELSVELDTDPKAAYMRQMHYGMLVRMALTEWVLNEE